MDLEIGIVVVLLVVFYFIFKSFKAYEEDNPYKIKDGDYSHSFSKENRAEIYSEVLQSEFGLIVALAAKVAKADGKVCALEEELLKNTFDELAQYFTNKKMARAILEEIFQEEGKEHDNTKLIATEFLKYTEDDPSKRVKVVEFLVNLSFIDKVFSAKEEESIRQIGFYLHVSNHEVNTIINNFKTYYKNYTPSNENPYVVLGVNEDVSENELKKAYRDLVKENHPDLIRAKGLEEDSIQEATKKLQKINEAYETIKKERFS